MGQGGFGAVGGEARVPISFYCAGVSVGDRGCLDESKAGRMYIEYLSEEIKCSKRS
jgi:hypothetical protein